MSNPNSPRFDAYDGAPGGPGRTPEVSDANVSPAIAQTLGGIALSKGAPEGDQA